MTQITLISFLSNDLQWERIVRLVADDQSRLWILTEKNEILLKEHCKKKFVIPGHSVIIDTVWSIVKNGDSLKRIPVATYQPAMTEYSCADGRPGGFIPEVEAIEVETAVGRLGGAYGS